MFFIQRYGHAQAHIWYPHHSLNVLMKLAKPTTLWKTIGWASYSLAFTSNQLSKALSKIIAQHALLFHTIAPYSLQSSSPKESGNTNLRSSSFVPAPYIFSTCKGSTNDFIFDMCAMSIFCQLQISYLCLVQTLHSIPMLTA